MHLYRAIQRAQRVLRLMTPRRPDAKSTSWLATIQETSSTWRIPRKARGRSGRHPSREGGAITLYADPEMRLAVSRAVAIETSRGWRIGKEKQSQKIDLVVALAQAALGAVRGFGSQSVTVRSFWGEDGDKPRPDPSDIRAERSARFERVTEDEMNYLANLRRQ
jgi:hypothetical protein